MRRRVRRGCQAQLLARQVRLQTRGDTAATQTAHWDTRAFRCRRQRCVGRQPSRARQLCRVYPAFEED